MNKANACVVVTAVGLVLILASQFWPKMAAARGDWGEEQAAEYTTAAHDVHRLSYGPDHDDSKPHNPATAEQPDAAKLAAARERLDAAKATLNHARSWRSGPQMWFKWTGIAATLCGAIGYMALRGQAAGE